MDSLALYMTPSPNRTNIWKVSIFDALGQEWVKEIHSESLEFENLVDTIVAVMVTATKKQEVSE